MILNFQWECVAAGNKKSLQPNSTFCSVCGRTVKAKKSRRAFHHGAAYNYGNRIGIGCTGSDQLVLAMSDALPFLIPALEGLIEKRAASAHTPCGLLVAMHGPDSPQEFFRVKGIKDNLVFLKDRLKNLKEAGSCLTESHRIQS